jgi:hypothetical protein
MSRPSRGGYFSAMMVCRLSSRQSTFVGTYALCNDVECFAGDDMILVSCHGSSDGRDLIRSDMQWANLRS